MGRRKSKGGVGGATGPWALAAIRACSRAAGRLGAVAGLASAAAVRSRVGEVRPLAVAGWLVGGGAVLAGSLAAVAAVLPEATPASSLAIVGTLPPWVPAEFAADAATAAQGPLYAPGRVAVVGRALAASPWVAAVTEVRRTDRLVATLRFRVPRFRVERGATTVILDTQGVVMPPLAAPLPSDVPLLRLDGLVGAPPTAGQPWAAAGLAEARHVAELLCGSRPTLAPPVTGLEVQRVGGRVRVWLDTSDRRRAEGDRAGLIEWGYADGGPNEVSADAKLANLIRLVRTVPHLAAVLDARVWCREPIYREPAPAPAARRGR